ncbi:MAG: acyltransferase [Lentilitoribacter sp.]
MNKTNPFNRGYYFSDELKEMGFKSVGANVQIAKSCTIIGLENIVLGDNIRIDESVTLACASGFLMIGNYVHIGGNCHITCAGGVELADFSGLSQGVRIFSGSDDYSGKSLTNPTIPKEFLNVTLKPVLIGRHVIIGSGSVVLPGVTIGEGSSVGALSLVTKSLDEWGIYLGNPAHKLKRRRKDLLEQEKLLLSQHAYR